MRKKKKKSKKTNPFLEYGVAIENFFNLETALIRIFFVLTLLCIPQMVIFACYDSFKGYQNSNLLDRISFGSMGQTSTVCSKIPNMGSDLTEFNFLFQCHKHYYISEVYGVGLQDYDENDIYGSL